MSADVFHVALVMWVMNTALFCMMGIDKRRARQGKRRIPEKRLFALAILGGAVGGWLGMYVFRHKTRHWYFRVGFLALGLAQIAGIVYVWRMF